MLYFISQSEVSNFTSINAINELEISTSLLFNLRDNDGFLIEFFEVDKIATANNRTWTTQDTEYDKIQKVIFSEEGQIIEREVLPDIIIPETDPEDLISESNFKVKIHENWDGYHQNTFKQIIEETLLKHVLSDITLSVPHGVVQKRMTKEDFEIHIWSSCEGERSQKPPKKMWDIPISCRDNGFTNSSKDCIRFKSRTWTVAELHDKKTLYIHHDICHNGTDNESELFQTLMNNVAKELEDPEIIKKLNKIENQKNLKNFVNLCVKGQVKKINRIEENITSYEKKINLIKENLIKEIQKKEHLQKELDSLKPNLKLDNEYFKKQYERLTNINNVTKVRIPEPEKLLIYTNELYCTDPRTNKIHEIGKFKITIDVKGREGGIKWKNMSRLVKNAYSCDGMQAPHVYADGHACLGNIEEAIAEYLGKYDFYTLVILAIKFIESCNVSDSAGTHINKWPVYNPETGQLEENKPVEVEAV